MAGWNPREAQPRLQASFAPLLSQRNGRSFSVGAAQDEEVQARDVGGGRCCERLLPCVGSFIVHERDLGVRERRRVIFFFSFKIMQQITRRLPAVLPRRDAVTSRSPLLEFYSRCPHFCSTSVPPFLVPYNTEICDEAARRGDVPARFPNGDNRCCCCCWA